MDMEDNLKEKLIALLKEMFQFSNSDLDFGIYKIMNYKHKEIEKFIKNDLIEQINSQLTVLNAEEDKKDLEAEVYNHLIDFFSRYYEEGDFVSVRRYGSREKYIIPYNGEEVYLYWANKDQYYVKTSTEFKRYSFYIENINGKLSINFSIVDAEEEQGNQKESEKKFFVLSDRNLKLDEGNKELHIFFEYRSLSEKEKRKFGSSKINQDCINKNIVKELSEKINSLNETLGFKDILNNKENGKSLLEKHIYKYTRKNTTDYFIHKDLRSFLERELDFYIKNEILRLDNIGILNNMEEYEKQMKKLLLKAKVVKNISSKIIEFLSTIEEFQKKLWEKKKFVIETQYVISLDKIKEYAGKDFFDCIICEILKNDKQKKEWKELFDLEVNNIEQLVDSEGNIKKLPIDTRYFNDDFKWRLLVALSKNNKLEEIIDGILIKSDNWHGLNLLLNKYKGKIDCIYTDPPYNKGNDDFLYKDNYKHSSWLSMIENRLDLVKNIMKDKGVMFISIDDNENFKLQNLMYNYLNYVDTLIVKSNPRGNQAKKITASMHEYVLVFCKNKLDNKLGYLKIEGNVSDFKFEDEKGKYREIGLRKRGAGARRKDAPNLYYPIYFDLKTNQIYLTKENDNLIEILPMLENGDEGRWRWSKENTLKNIDKLICRKVKRKNSFESYDVFEKDYLTEDKVEKIKSILDEKEVNYEKATEEIKNMGLYYKYPKPVYLIMKLVNSLYYLNKQFIIVDFFAGSGTTAHAVMKLNAKDKGERKFILIDIANYFDTIIIPRIKKISCSFNWRNGIPQDTEGVGIFVKYQILEQYEDTLENIEFSETNPLLNTLPDYFLKYSLKWETKESNVFLNTNNTQDPFSYKLKVFSNYELMEVNIDLIETFNYLLGLNINRYEVVERNNKRYIFVFGEKDDKKIVVVWRNIKDINWDEDKLVITEIIGEYNSDELFINGECIVEGFKQIEEEFRKLMFTHGL